MLYLIDEMRRDPSRRPATAEDQAPDGSASDSTHLARKINTGDAAWELWAQADPGQVCVDSFNGEPQRAS